MLRNCGNYYASCLELAQIIAMRISDVFMHIVNSNKPTQILGQYNVSDVRVSQAKGHRFNVPSRHAPATQGQPR